MQKNLNYEDFIIHTIHLLLVLLFAHLPLMQVFFWEPNMAIWRQLLDYHMKLQMLLQI